MRLTTKEKVREWACEIDGEPIDDKDIEVVRDALHRAIEAAPQDKLRDVFDSVVLALGKREWVFQKGHIEPDDDIYKWEIDV